MVAGGYAYTTNTAWDSVGFSYLPGSVSIIDTAADLLVDADADAANGTDTPVFTSRINPQDLDVDGSVDENGPYIEMGFALPPGCYATMILREICKEQLQEGLEEPEEEAES